MSNNDATDHTGGAPRVLRFGGRPLRTLAGPSIAGGLSVSDTDALAELGFVDCEQLIAATAVPGVSEKLQKSLGLNRQGFNSLVRTARSELTDERAELVSRLAPRNLGLGLRRPSADSIAAAQLLPRARAVSAAEAEALPEFVDLIPLMSPIRHQRRRTTCAAFALTALNEYVLGQDGLDEDLSEQHLYYEAKRIDGDRTGCGTWLAKAAIALRDRGQCRESVWPYEPSLPCDDQGTLPSTARSDGLNYRLNTFAISERSVAAYKAQLAQQRPVVLSIPTYDSWYLSNEVRRSGRITMRVGNEPSPDGHALVAVGYRNSPSDPGGGHFAVKNSWGTDWAYESPYGAGYGTIPYQYITNDAWEAYSTMPDGEQVDETTTIVRIKVGSNVEITIEDVIPDNPPERVSRVSRGRGSGPRPLRVSRAAGPLDDEYEE